MNYDTQIDKLDELSNISFWTPEILHNAINNNFEMYDLKSLKFHTYTEEVIELLAQLPSIDTFKFLKIIDTALPGMSFHFIIENVNFIYQGSELCYKKLLFSFRASYYLACFPEKQMLAPMRTRLCNDLLFADIDKNLFLEFQQKRHDIDKREFILEANKKLIKKNLYMEYFQAYIYILTTEKLECDEDDTYECE